MLSLSLVQSLSYSAILMAVEQQVHKTLADALELRSVQGQPMLYVCLHPC